MRNRIDKIFVSHEAEDCDYIRDRAEIVRRIKSEFANSQEVLQALTEDSFSDLLFDYTRTEPVAWQILPVRTSDRLYFKKHTLTQRPYYHGHDFYEFVYVYKGSCTLYTSPSEEPRKLLKGEAVMACPAAVHAIGKARASDVIVKAVIPKRYARILGSAAESEGHVFYKVTAEAENCIYKAVEEDFARRRSYERAVTDWLELAFIELARGNEATSETKPDSLQTLLNSYLDDGHADAGLEGFAAFAGYSAGYAGRSVKNLTGMTFSQLSETRKFERAKQMLGDTSLSVEAVAEALGYKNASGIYKLFFRQLGTTPGRYRESLKNK